MSAAEAIIEYVEARIRLDRAQRDSGESAVDLQKNTSQERVDIYLAEQKLKKAFDE